MCYKERAMKKLLSIATLLGMLSGAASAAPYVLPSHQPGALTPYDVQPVYSVEGLYAIADDSGDPDTYGARLRLNIYSNGADITRQQFSLNVAGMWGSDDYKSGDCCGDYDMFMLPVTVGYELNIELSDSALLYMGGKVGYSWVNIDNPVVDTTAGGFTFSVGGGLKFQCSDAVYVNVGYEFARTYLDDSDVDYNFGQHVISVGIGCQF